MNRVGRLVAGGADVVWQQVQLGSSDVREIGVVRHLVQDLIGASPELVQGLPALGAVLTIEYRDEPINLVGLGNPLAGPGIV